MHMLFLNFIAYSLIILVTMHMLGMIATPKVVHHYFTHSRILPCFTIYHAIYIKSVAYHIVKLAGYLAENGAAFHHRKCTALE